MVFPNSGAILHVTMWSVVVPGSQHNSSPTPSGVGQESDMSFAFLGNRSPLLIQHLVPRHSMGPPKNTCFFCFIYQMTLGRFLLFAFNVCLFFFFFARLMTHGWKHGETPSGEIRGRCYVFFFPCVFREQLHDPFAGLRGPDTAVFPSPWTPLCRPKCRCRSPRGMEGAGNGGPWRTSGRSDEVMCKPRESPKEVRGSHLPNPFFGGGARVGMSDVPIVHK